MNIIGSTVKASLRNKSFNEKPLSTKLVLSFSKRYQSEYVIFEDKVLPFNRVKKVEEIATGQNAPKRTESIPVAQLQ